MIEDQDIINYVTDENIKIIVYDDNETGLIGFSSFRIWDKDKTKADLDTYVVPSSRRRGIGTLLYNVIMKYTAEINLNFINTRFRVDKDDATLLYKKLGYEKWYGEHDLPFLLINNENLIASVAVDDNGFIDDLFVVPSYQGNGYGKIITQFAINKAINNRNSNIQLNVVDGNTRALNLYQSLGFDIVQTTHYYRLFKV